MFLKHIDLTTALRPSYLPDEVLLFVQDNVGLYEGKLKLPKQQNGQVYLTSHRVCYVDQEEPRVNSLALDLRDVDRYEFYAGFLKSSAKITVIAKPPKRSSLRPHALSNASSQRYDATSSPRAEPPSRPKSLASTTSSVTWVCTICSYSNPLPSNFDPGSANAHTPLPPCLACGIRPTLAHVLKAAIKNATNRTTLSPVPTRSSPLPFNPMRHDSAHLSKSAGSSSPLDSGSPRLEPRDQLGATAPFHCPRCTFENHPSLLSCEICGGPLLSQRGPEPDPTSVPDTLRIQSPGPFSEISTKNTSAGIDISDSIKLSFRSGGEKIFYERLKGSMAQRKWLLTDAPPPPRSHQGSSLNGIGDSSPESSSGRPKGVGIAGLEQLGLNMRKNNEILIGNAFEDLEALMASAKDIVALAERFARQNHLAGDNASAEENAFLAESANQLGLVTTKDIVGGGSSASLYLSELSRTVAEYLTDDARGVLKSRGGIITLVDLWAMFNRARGGVELVSPMDFEKSARLWESLRLPVRLRTFRSGVMVVQGRDRTDETTIRSLESWLKDLHEFPPGQDVTWDWRAFGRGVTARDAAERFGWSMGVAEEELLMAEERGVLCREEGVEGLKFWENFIDTGDIAPAKSQIEIDQEAIVKNLQASGIL